MQFITQYTHSSLSLTLTYRGLPVFLLVLNQKFNVVILSPRYPGGLSTETFVPFNGMCAWVKGSALNITDLLRAGILQVSLNGYKEVFWFEKQKWVAHSTGGDVAESEMRKYNIMRS